MTQLIQDLNRCVLNVTGLITPRYALEVTGYVLNRTGFVIKITDFFSSNYDWVCTQNKCFPKSDCNCHSGFIVNMTDLVLNSYGSVLNIFFLLLNFTGLS